MIGVCCPTLRVTSNGPAKTAQSSKLGTYEYHKQGSNGKEIFKQIGGQQYLYFLKARFNDYWMVSYDIGHLATDGRNLLFIICS